MIKNKEAHLDIPFRGTEQKLRSPSDANRNQTHKQETKMKPRILTGDRPTGALHLGHYVGSLANRVKLQATYDCYFIIADYQVLTDHLKDTAKIAQNIREITLDYLSVGIDPEKSTIFIQSMVPQIAELTMIFSMLVSVGRLKRNPTVKEELAAAGMKRAICHTASLATQSHRQQTSSRSVPTSFLLAKINSRTWSKPARSQGRSTGISAKSSPSRNISWASFPAFPDLMAKR